MPRCNGHPGQFCAEQLNPPVCVTRDRQLASVNLSVALFKWDHGIACNLKEVAIVTGYYYAQVRRWGLPLFEGKITRSEFIAWKRKRMADRHVDQSAAKEALGLDRSVGPATAARQRRLSRHKFDRCVGIPSSSTAGITRSLPEASQTLHGQNAHQ
jgi:hypothetical protein